MIANNALLLLLLVLAVAGGWTLARGGLRMDDARATRVSIFIAGLISCSTGRRKTLAWRRAGYP